ncbi:MAG: UDP-3-O-acyl-N-acetylglucosamine deacetylase [Pseudomonadota bacterium]
MQVDHLHRSRQATVREVVSFEGIGLHSGAQCRVRVSPGGENTGIVFRRWNGDRINHSVLGPTEIAEATIIASPVSVVRSNHGTTIANDFGASIATIEHLMAAFAILRVDNAVVDVFGPEIPILDGSAAPFVVGIRKAGLRSQKAARNSILIEEPILIEDGARSFSVEPAETFSLEISIVFDDCFIGQQTLSITLSDEDMIDRLASARTFCRLNEVDALRQAGLIQGGSLDNSIVVDGERVLNRDALRDPEEFVLHKALDVIGDLYLLGAPICGAVRAIRPGHDLNCRAALAIDRRAGAVSNATAAAHA